MKKRNCAKWLVTGVLLCFGMLVGCAKEEPILNIEPETVQSIEVFLYDTVKNETAYGWCYREEDMEEMLSYLSTVSGEELEEFPLAEWPEHFWGIVLNAGPTNPKLLIVGDYLITAEGQCYQIDGARAEDVCKNMQVEESRKSEGIPYVINRRYAAEQNGAFRPAFLYRVERDLPLMEGIIMQTGQESYGAQDNRIDFTITNKYQEEILYGSQVMFEVLVDDIWYSMDDMLAQNVNIGWNDLLHIQQSEDTLEDAFYIEFYQPLLPGTYRLVKEFTLGEVNGYAACEFVIE